MVVEDNDDIENNVEDDDVELDDMEDDVVKNEDEDGDNESQEDEESDFALYRISILSTRAAMEDICRAIRAPIPMRNVL